MAADMPPEAHAAYTELDLRVVSIIDEYPLWSKKAADYEVWREAVLYWNAPRRYPKTTRRAGLTTRVIQAIDWSPLAELHGELREVRRYTERRGLRPEAVSPDGATEAF